MSRRLGAAGVYGAATVVMAFDERGQADTLERRIEVCARAYRILAETVGFPLEDIILDPNVFAIVPVSRRTGTTPSRLHRTCRWIREHLPGAKTSGGISNVSFAFAATIVCAKPFTRCFSTMPSMRG